MGQHRWQTAHVSLCWLVLQQETLQSWRPEKTCQLTQWRRSGSRVHCYSKWNSYNDKNNEIITIKQGGKFTNLHAREFSRAISRFGQVYTVTYFFLAAWPFVAAVFGWRCVGLQLPVKDTSTSGNQGRTLPESGLQSKVQTFSTVFGASCLHALQTTFT